MQSEEWEMCLGENEVLFQALFDQRIRKLRVGKPMSDLLFRMQGSHSDTPQIIG